MRPWCSWMYATGSKPPAKKWPTSRFTLKYFDMSMPFWKVVGVENSLGSVTLAWPCKATTILCFSANGTSRFAMVILVRFQDETNDPGPSGQTSQRLGICRHPREASFKLTDDCLH